MEARSFLPASAVDRIGALRRRALETRFALADVTYLVLHRWDEAAGAPVVRPAQQVLVEFDARQPTLVSDASGQARTFGGTFEREVPFDVRAGDRFVLGGQRGTVILVRPPVHGTQVAEFTMDGGVA